ncbi:MAG: hypothetical protein MHPSP_002244, partial [Paramarteilia canceri]
MIALLIEIAIINLIYRTVDKGKIVTNFYNRYDILAMASYAIPPLFNILFGNMDNITQTSSNYFYYTEPLLHGYSK